LEQLGTCHTLHCGGQAGREAKCQGIPAQQQEWKSPWGAASMLRPAVTAARPCMHANTVNATLPVPARQPSCPLACLPTALPA
jgi:hypothetical protein